MLKSETLRVAIVVILGLAVFLFSIVHAHHLHTQALQEQAEIQQLKSHYAGLIRQIIPGIKKEPEPGDVARNAAIVLSKFRKEAGLYSVTIGQVTLAGSGGGTGSSNLSSLAASAKASKTPGLREVQVITSGSWETLADMRTVLRTLGSGLVKITGLDLGKNFYRLQFSIYGR